MKELMFQNQPVRMIEQDGKQWASAADIARALGYERADSVTRIYDRYKIEFSGSMTCLVMMPDPDRQFDGPGQSRMARVFSLRGAHLIGMFSRTARAQAFRRWVLDVLEANRAEPSLIQEWFAAKAALDAQDKFASLCGKGLNEHKLRKPPLLDRLGVITEKIQPSLAFN